MLTIVATVMMIVACVTVFAGGEGEEQAQSAPPSESENATAGSGSVTNKGIELSWDVVDDQLEVSVAAPTTGWVAVGFKPTRAMQDANILIGYVSGDEVVVTDQFGVATVQHRLDTEIGGSVDVTVIGGGESDGVTTLAFSIPLDSGDEYDQVLASGEMIRVIMAYGENDDIESYHRDRTIVEITL